MTDTLGSIDARSVSRRLRDGSGLRLQIGPFVVEVGALPPDVAASLRALYADYPLASSDAFVDFRVGVRRRAAPGRPWTRQVVFGVEGQEPFNPLPGDQGFPLLEWGLNWCVYSMCHQYLILHAAVLERAGRALVLPAPSGSGKSTLCAGLLFHGWRLLSDELALIDPHDGRIVPVPRPVSLKNASIEAMRRFAPTIRFDSRVEDTAKGIVAHFAAPAASVAAAAVPARPGWVVVPRFVAGAPARLQPIEKAHAFMSLVENAFNYDVFGVEGFELLAALVDRCETYEFEYGDLAEAVAVFARLADGPAAAA